MEVLEKEMETIKEYLRGRYQEEDEHRQMKTVLEGSFLLKRKGSGSESKKKKQIRLLLIKF